MKFSNPENLVSFVLGCKLPEWQTKLFSKFRTEVQVHSRGQLFYKLDQLFPNESLISKQHRVMAFEPITKGSFNKGVTNINRILSNSSYTCETAEKTEQVITGNNFEGKDLFNYFTEEWMNIALGMDPNALIVVYPPEGENKFPKVEFISSEHILFFDKETFIFKSECESEMKYSIEDIIVQNQLFFDHSIGGTNVTEKVTNGYNERVKATFEKTTYHVFERGKFTRVKQLEDGKYEVSSIKLPANILPVTVAGGNKAYKNVFESFLSPFVHFGNLALFQHSQHTAVNFMFSFPRMSEIQSACENPQCDAGNVECEVSTLYPNGLRPCVDCGGSGFRAVQSPYKVYIKKYDPSGLTEDNKALMDSPDVRFYTPDTAILDYSKNEWKDYLEAAEMAIYVQHKIDTGNVQSAKSKQIDMDELYAFLQRVSSVFYARLQSTIQFIENYVLNAASNVVVNIPYSFAILSEEDAFKNLNNILTSGAPAIIKFNQIESFILKFVSQSSPVKKAFDILKKVDLLLLKTEAEIATLKANSIVTPEQWSIHIFSYPVLLKMYEEDESLFKLDISQIADKLTAELLKLKPVVPDLKKAIIDKFPVNG